MSLRFQSVVVLVAVFALSASVVAGPPVKYKRETVREGDTLSGIAKRHGVSVDALVRLNNLPNRHVIRTGQALKIKRIVAAKAAKKVEAVKTAKTAKTAKTKAAGKRKAAVKASKGAARTVVAKKKAKTRVVRGRAWIRHKVRVGDSLWKIADRYNVTMRYLKKNNGLGRRPVIHPGRVLKVKRGAEAKLFNGVQLPAQGQGYVRMRALRSYGTPGTVRLIREVYSEFARLHPDSVPACIADLSKKTGGHLPPHRSHQRGVDVDVSYYKVGNIKTRGLEVVTPKTIDIAKTWDVIRLYLNTGHVSAIYMDHGLQGALYHHLVKLGYEPALLKKIVQYPRKPSQRVGIIRYSPGHHHHMHVRFDCTKSNDLCRRPAMTWIPARSEKVLSETADADGGVQIKTESAPVALVVPRRAEEAAARRPRPHGKLALAHHWTETLYSDSKRAVQPSGPVALRQSEPESRAARLGPATLKRARLAHRK
jgi:LysM repeat protein